MGLHKIVCRIIEAACFASLILFDITAVTGNWIKLMGDDVGNQKASFINYADSSINLPGSRSDAATWYDQTSGNVWLFGGYGYGNETSETAVFLNDLWLFNSTLEEWVLVNSGKLYENDLNGKKYVPRNRKGAVACGVSGTVLVIFGGESKYKLNDTWLYDIKSEKWLPLFLASDNVANPSPRSHSSDWCLRDRLIIFGGAGMYKSILSDMWEFSLGNLLWQPIEQHTLSNIDSDTGTSKPIPLPRIGSSVWIYKDKLYMFGGTVFPETRDIYKQSALSLLNDMWYFDLSTKSWSLLLDDRNVSYRFDTLPNPRLLAYSWKQDQDLYLFGGYGGHVIAEMQSETDFLHDVWKYDLKLSTWNKIQSFSSSTSRINVLHNIQHVVNISEIPSQRCCGATWNVKNAVYIFGGLGYDGRRKVSYLNDLYMGCNESYASGLALETAIQRMVREISPPIIFAICFASFGSVVCIFGAMFFIKKMIDYPQHAPENSKYNVKYSPVNEEINIDTNIS